MYIFGTGRIDIATRQWLRRRAAVMYNSNMTQQTLAFCGKETKL